jgi:hypothetical protein
LAECADSTQIAAGTRREAAMNVSLTPELEAFVNKKVESAKSASPPVKARPAR